jgi:HSP20 family protein
MNGLIRYSRPAELFDWNRLIDNFFDDVPAWETRRPAVDVRENEKAYQMEVELPGLTEKDIEVKVEENLLTLSSKKDEKREEKQKDYLIRERRHTEFKRSFVLPEEISRDKIKAEFKNGLLTVMLPKIPKAQPKLIDVKVN